MDQASIWAMKISRCSLASQPPEARTRPLSQSMTNPASFSRKDKISMMRWICLLMATVCMIIPLISKYTAPISAESPCKVHQWKAWQTRRSPKYRRRSPRSRGTSKAGKEVKQSINPSFSRRRANLKKRRYLWGVLDSPTWHTLASLRRPTSWVKF